ncbi:MAG: SAM hydrolase/SAM-dependent halogenase family protein [Desulforhopalus sp.]
MARPIITLTTDFGLDDEYVGVMKGVILRHCPDIRMVDICHNVPPQDILTASHLLFRSFPYFPPSTVHLVVVDPGVGSKRAILAMSAGEHLFVGPDNGVFTPILAQYRPLSVHRVSQSALFLHPVSDTFHGRDIMAPVAAHLATGLTIDRVGPAVTTEDCVVAPIPSPEHAEGELQGIVTHIDRFGNLATNITRRAVENFAAGGAVAIRIGNTVIRDFSASYAGLQPGTCMALFDSQNCLEIAVNQDSAARTLNIAAGAKVVIVRL